MAGFTIDADEIAMSSELKATEMEGLYGSPHPIETIDFIINCKC